MRSEEFRENLFTKQITLTALFHAVILFRKKKWRKKKLVKYTKTRQENFLWWLVMITYVYKPFCDRLTLMDHDNILLYSNGNDGQLLHVDILSTHHPIFVRIIWTVPYWSDIVSHVRCNCKLLRREKGKTNCN